MPSKETLALLVAAGLVACDGSSGDSASSAAGHAGTGATLPAAGASGQSATGGRSGASGSAGAKGGTGGATGGTAGAMSGTAGTTTAVTGGAPSAGAFGSGGKTGEGGGDTAGASGDASRSGVSYSTNFGLSESPISEDGAWHHDGLDWTTVDTADGIALGTQALGVSRSGPEGYDDSYAYLAGFPPDQAASAVVALGAIDASCTHEVELLLRWADSAHNARGYECNVAFDGSYAQIVRWNGPVGDYMYLGAGNVPGGMHDGDTVSASIVGDTITLSVNGTVRATAQDRTFADGNPGVGFWRGDSGCGTLGDYGFASFGANEVTP